MAFNGSSPFDPDYFGSWNDITDKDSFIVGLPTTVRAYPDSLTFARAFKDGDSTFEARFLWNETGSTIAANTLVEYVSGGSTNMTPCATASRATPRLAGVTLVEIPTGYGGWVAYRGKATVKDSGSGFSANDLLKSTTTSGTVATNAVASAADAAGIVGVALATVAASGTGLARLAIP